MNNKKISQLRAIWYAGRKQQLADQWRQIYALGGNDAEYAMTQYKNPIYYLKALQKGVVNVRLQKV